MSRLEKAEKEFGDAIENKAGFDGQMHEYMSCVRQLQFIEEQQQFVSGLKARFAKTDK